MVGVDRILRLNSTILSWQSSQFSIMGVPYEGLLSIDFEQARERKIVKGMRRDGTPLGKTSGTYSVKGLTVRFLPDTYDLITTQLTALGLGSYGDAEFPIIFQYVEPLKLPQTIIWTGCTIDGEKDGLAEGIDEAGVDVTIGALTCVRNGKFLYSLQRLI
jgi:hypothetical protein